jgi:hypothetical protein
VTEWLLPGLGCPCCWVVTFAAPPPGAHAGAVSYGPVLNAAAVLLTCYGNVPPERAARVIGMLLGIGDSVTEIVDITLPGRATRSRRRPTRRSGATASISSAW